MSFFYQTQEEIDELVEGFNTKTLPKENWTHEAHLTVAIWHLKNFDINESTCRLRSGIISYNLSVGGINTGTVGYHETMTIFWITVVDYFIKLNMHKSLIDCCNDFLKSSFADKTLPFYFYDKANILSSNARARFIPADKVELNDALLEALYIDRPVLV